jgi:hypothetical protein
VDDRVAAPTATKGYATPTQANVQRIPRHPAEYADLKPRKTVRLDPTPIIIEQAKELKLPCSRTDQCSNDSPAAPRDIWSQQKAALHYQRIFHRPGFKPILKNSVVNMDPNQEHRPMQTQQAPLHPQASEAAHLLNTQQQQVMRGHSLAVQMQRNLQLKDVSTQMTPPTSIITAGTDYSSQYPREETRSKLNTSDEEETTAADVETLTVDSGKDPYRSSPAKLPQAFMVNRAVPKAGLSQYPPQLAVSQDHTWTVQGFSNCPVYQAQTKPDGDLSQPGVHPGLAVNFGDEAGSELMKLMPVSKENDMTKPKEDARNSQGPEIVPKMVHVVPQAISPGYNPLCGYLKTCQNVHTLPNHLPSTNVDGPAASTSHKLVSSCAKTDLLCPKTTGGDDNQPQQPTVQNPLVGKSWRDVLMGKVMLPSAAVALQITSPLTLGQSPVVPSATADVVTNAQGDFSQSVSENNTSKDISHLSSSRIDWAAAAQQRDRSCSSGQHGIPQSPTCNSSQKPGGVLHNNQDVPGVATSSSFLVQKHSKEQLESARQESQKDMNRMTDPPAKPTAEELMTAILNAQKANDVFGRMGIDFTSCWDPRVFQALTGKLRDSANTPGGSRPPSPERTAGSAKMQDVRQTVSRSFGRNSGSDLQLSRHDVTALKADPSNHSKWGDIMSSQLTHDDSVHQIYPPPGQTSTYERDNSPCGSSRHQQTGNSQMRAVDPTNLYFANLPKQIRDCDLVRVVDEFGPVVSAKLMENPALKLKGVGFVRMRFPQDCEKVIRMMNGKPFPGTRKALSVKLAWKSKDTENTSASGYNKHNHNYQSTASDFTPHGPFKHGGTTYFGPGSTYGVLSPGESSRQFGLWPQSDGNIGGPVYQPATPLTRAFTPAPTAYYTGSPVPPGPMFAAPLMQGKDGFAGYAPAYAVQGIEYYVPSPVDPSSGQAEGTWGLWTPPQPTFEQAFFQPDGTIVTQGGSQFVRDPGMEMEPNTAGFYAQAGMPQAIWINPQQAFVQQPTMAQAPFYASHGMPNGGMHSESFPVIKPNAEMIYGVPSGMISPMTNSGTQFFSATQGSQAVTQRQFAYPPGLNISYGHGPPPGLSMQQCVSVSGTDLKMGQRNVVLDAAAGQQARDDCEQGLQDQRQVEVAGQEEQTMNSNTSGDQVDMMGSEQNTRSLTGTQSPTQANRAALVEIVATGNENCNLGSVVGLSCPHQRSPHTIASAKQKRLLKNTTSEQLTWRSSGDGPQRKASGTDSTENNGCGQNEGKTKWKVPSYKTFPMLVATRSEDPQMTDPPAAQQADTHAEGNGHGQLILLRAAVPGTRGDETTSPAADQATPGAAAAEKEEEGQGDRFPAKTTAPSGEKPSSITYNNRRDGSDGGGGGAASGTISPH